MDAINSVRGLLKIEGTNTTPTIVLDAKQGIIEIRGRWTINMFSTPKNATEFLDPLLGWLDKYGSLLPNETKVIVHLECLEPSGNQSLLVIFKRLEYIFKNMAKVQIYWFYTDGDLNMLESGEDFAEIIRLPFNMISY